MKKNTHAAGVDAHLQPQRPAVGRQPAYVAANVESQPRQPGRVVSGRYRAAARNHVDWPDRLHLGRGAKLIKSYPQRMHFGSWEETQNKALA